MILTDKCLKDFYNFIFNNIKEQHFGDLQDVYDYINYLPKPCKCALIIDFFDSVGITIIINNQNLQTWFFYEIKTFEAIRIRELVRTRQECTEQAIEKANEIYNNK